MTTPNKKNATQNTNNKNNILNSDNIFPDIIAPPPPPSSSTKNKTTTRTTITKTTTVIPASANFPSFPSTPSSSSSSSSNKKSPFASLTKSLSQSSQSSSNRKPPQRQQSGSSSGGGGGRKWSKYPGANIQKQTLSKTTTKQPSSSSSKQQQQPPKSSSPKQTKKHPPPPPTSTTTTSKTKVYPQPSTIYLRNYLPPASAASSLSLVESEICQRSVSEEEFLSLSVRQKRKIGDAFDRMNTPVLLQIVMPDDNDDDDDVDVIVESQEDEKGKNNKTEEEENVKQENGESSDGSSNTEEKEQRKKDDLDLKTIDKAEKKKKKKDKIIYEAASSASSSSIIPLHPHWDYINEQCRFFDPEKKKKNDFDKKETNEKMGKRDSHKEDHDRHKKGNDNNNEEKETKWKDDTYQSLKIRVLVNINFQTFAHDDKKNNTSESSSSLLEPILLAEIPIHPTQLRRLPPTTTNTTPPSSFTIPNKLPPNSIIIQYTDNTLRVHPQLYHHLLSKKVIQECRTDENVMEDIMEEHKRTRRFDDDVFDILDGAGGDEESEGEEETGGKEEASLNSPSRLLGDVNGTTGGTTTKNQNGAALVGGRKNNSSAFSNDDLFDLLGTDDGNNDSKKAAQQQQDNTTPINTLAASTENGTNAAAQPEKEASSSPATTTTTTTMPAQEMVCTRTESQIHSMELQKQVDLLRKVLKEEEESLEMDRDLLCREMEELKLLLEQEQDIEKETLEIQEHTKKEVEHLAQAEFILEARRVKLLRDLRQIYPIRAFPDNTFAIRGIKLPTDILDPAVPDEIVSAALGFACHLVFMCSKYLAIPLRYRLICNSSRSAVQDDGNGVFPLFKERVIDLKQLERAVILLERDIECLLYTRGISFSPLWHMLAKLDQLFERTTKGGGINP